MALRTVPDIDDRITCSQCANIGNGGPCLAAKRREIVASATYTPDRALLRRCEAYRPGPDDSDKRSGKQRWPNLLAAAPVDGGRK